MNLVSCRSVSCRIQNESGVTWSARGGMRRLELNIRRGFYLLIRKNCDKMKIRRLKTASYARWLWVIPTIKAGCQRVSLSLNAWAVKSMRIQPVLKKAKHRSIFMRKTEKLASFAVPRHHKYKLKSGNLRTLELRS